MLHFGFVVIFLVQVVVNKGVVMFLNQTNLLEETRENSGAHWRPNSVHNKAWKTFVALMN